LSAQEVLALAISLEEEDGRIYQDYARMIREENAVLATALGQLRDQEDEHRKILTDFYHEKFGDEIPLIRREDIAGFVNRPKPSVQGKVGAREIARTVALMEFETQRVYEKAASNTTDVQLRKLLSDLAEAEREHESAAEETLTGTLVNEAETRRQMFVLQVIQPGLAGLMDGSVSTLAPLFAAAFASHKAGNPNATWETFLIGTAASVGAGISMGFAEGLSDNGSLTGRGKPLVRGIVTGLMTFLGGIFHALPFLIQSFGIALWVAVAVVTVELILISYIRNRYMDTPFLRSVFQVVVGGVLVFLAGILIGNS
jgi:rubrerythrin